MRWTVDAGGATTGSRGGGIVAVRRGRVVARHLADDAVGLDRLVRVRRLEAVHAAEGVPGAVRVDDARLGGGEGLRGRWWLALSTQSE